VTPSVFFVSASIPAERNFKEVYMMSSNFSWGRAGAALTIVAGLAAIGSHAAAQTVVVPVPAAQTEVLIAPSPPPSPKVEVIPPVPGTRMAWQAGRWAWSGSNWEWVPGQYVALPQTASIWVPGQWQPASNGGYTWVGGHWR
jgi:hypothetical protein